MVSTHNLGDNWDLEEDANGDLRFTYTPTGESITWDGSTNDIDAAGKSLSNLGSLSNVKIVTPSDGVSGIQTAIDDLTTNGGGTVLLTRGTFPYSTTEINLKSNVSLVGCGYGTEIRLEDATDSNAVTAIRGNAVTGAEVRNLRINGNAGNQTISSHPNSPFAQGIRLYGDSEDCKVSNVWVHDVIRSNVVMSGVGNLWKNLHLRNSYTDHLIYCARAVGSRLENATLEGYSRPAPIAIGTSSYSARDNVLQGLTLRGLQTSPVETDHPSTLLVNFRSVSTGSPRGNTVELTHRATDRQGRIVVSQPHAEVKVNYEGPIDGSVTSPRLLRVDTDGVDARVDYDAVAETVSLGSTYRVAKVEGDGADVEMSADLNGDANAQGVIIENPAVRQSLDLNLNVGGPKLVTNHSGTHTFDRLRGLNYDDWTKAGTGTFTFRDWVEQGDAGYGVIVKDADGSGRFRIRVNAGAVEAEGPL